MKYVSDIITGKEFKLGQFNLIASGTGTGKTEFVRRTLLNKFDRFGPLEPSEILYVTSRSMIRDQQAELDGISKFDTEHERDVIRYWNDEDSAELDRLKDAGIWIMNYNQFVYVLDCWPTGNGRSLSKVKVAVFDECHALFTDEYIRGMGIVRQWIRERIEDGGVLLIGMTATNGVVNFNNPRLNMAAVQVNDEYIVNYKAKNLIVTKMDCFRDMIRKMPGKTIVMMATVKECNAFKATIPNSVVLVSHRNAEFTDEMASLRNYIIEHQSLPASTGMLGWEVDHPIDVLITTTTMREGINLREGSGVKNVVCSIPDEVHVKQFVGRCRFNVENLVVIYKYVSKFNKLKRWDYVGSSYAQFKNYIYNKADREWFDSIADIVDVPFEGIQRYGLEARGDDFCKWIDENWLSTDDNVIRIGMDECDQIAKEAVTYRILKVPTSRYTFLAVAAYLEEAGRYSVTTERHKVKGIKKTFKYIWKNETEEEENGYDEYCEEDSYGRGD